MDESINISRKRYRRLGSNIQTTTGDATYAFQIEVTFLQAEVRCTHVHYKKRKIFACKKFIPENTFSRSGVLLWDIKVELIIP